SVRIDLNIIFLMHFEKFEKHSHFFKDQISGESVSKSDTDQGMRKGYVRMKKEEAVVFLRNHGHQAMIENGVVMIIMAQNGSTVKKIGRFLREAGYHSSYGVRYKANSDI